MNLMDADSQFYKLSQFSLDLKESLNVGGLKDEDIANLIEKHISMSYNENQMICDFVQGADWLNVAEPISLHAHLNDKIVVLDFWTYCCINCLHMLPELKKIENAYTSGDNVIFIGVHSAKFDHEKYTHNVKDAVLRHKITHPVINDHGAMWSALGINCWPTILVLGPNSRPLYVQIGEGGLEILDKYIKQCVKYFKSAFNKSSHKVMYKITDNFKSTSPLYYPGKVATFKAKDFSLLAVSDSANNRIIVIKNNKDVVNLVGGSQKGYRDGDVGTALFANPQGIAFYNENIIFVADCENHCIRKIDLLQKKVITIAGPHIRHINKDDECEIEFQMRSPWDLALYIGNDLSNTQDKKPKSVLFIAMAGTHQIWALFLDSFLWWKNKKYSSGSCHIVSGTGKEENRNNIYPMSASFAQPSGLTLNYDLKEMYVADSESSTIRKICLNTGKVSLLVGGEKDPYNLFAYGDLDGSGVNAKLKHPLDVAWSSKHKCLFVADSFNNKIKVIDVSTNTIKSIWQELEFKEPGGICLSSDEDYLLVANTNNHSIDIINITLGTKNTMNLNFQLSQKKVEPSRNIMTAESILQKTVFVANMKQVVFSVRFIETTIKLNKEVKQNWRVRNDENKNILKKKEVCDNIFRVVIEFDDDSVCDHIYMTFRLALCTGEICFMKIFSLDYDIIRDKNKCVSYDVLTENTLVTLENNEMKVISSMATFT